LLVTRCDRCLRTRACAPVWPGWFCRQCLGRMARAATVKLAEFKRQERQR
jgi:hypothetical protein